MGGRCLWPRLVVLLFDAKFLIRAKPSTPFILAVEGRLMWLELRENERSCVADVGVLIRLLILLIRAWFSAVDMRGTLDFRSARVLGWLMVKGSDSWLAFAMSSNALAGKSGTSNSVASAAG